MLQELEQKLESIVNHTFKYEGKIYKAQSFKSTGVTIVLFTDRRSFAFHPTEMEEFLNKIELNPEASEPFIPSVQSKRDDIQTHKHDQKVSLAVFEPTDAQKKIQASLLDMIDKVASDPTAIPQAKAVCDIANTMVNIERSQIQLMNLARKQMRK